MEFFHVHRSPQTPMFIDIFARVVYCPLDCYEVNSGHLIKKIMFIKEEDDDRLLF